MKIKIAFSDFWVGFKPDYNWFYLFLLNKFEIELSEQPDFLIYSVYGKRHLTFNCIKIFYTAENVRPNFSYCDYAMSFDFIDNPKHLRLPLYSIIYGLDPENLLLKEKNIELFLKKKNKFCAMVISQPNSQKRIDFFHKLSKYKQIDSGGKYLNNVGGPVRNKLEFISNYKFTFAFENASFPGYVTEKIYEPMFVNSIPIYWGSELINLDFNTKSFINYHDYKSDDEVIERIIQLDQDKYKMAELLHENWFSDNKLNQYLNRELLYNYFNMIFSTRINPVSNTIKGKVRIFKMKSRIYLSKMKKSII